MMRGEVWRWAARGSGFAAGAALIVAIIYVLQSSAQVFVLTLISILLASALNPFVDWVRRRSRLTRVTTVLGVYAAFMILTAILLLLVVPAAVDELTTFGERVPQLLEDLRGMAAGLEPEPLRTALEQMIETAEKSLAAPAVEAPDPGLIVEASLSAADAVISVITVLSLTFFWMIGREPMQRFGLALLPAERRAGVRDGWNESESRLGLWVRGQLILMTTVGVAATVAYFVLGLENALLLGVIAGIAEIIPIVGPALGAIPALASAVVSGGPELALLVAGVYVVIQILEGNVLVPLVMKNAVGLPPFLVIISLLVGAAVGGLVGALLAIPIAAMIIVILERVQAREEPVLLHGIEGSSDAVDDDDGDEPAIAAGSTPD